MRRALMPGVIALSIAACGGGDEKAAIGPPSATPTPKATKAAVSTPTASSEADESESDDVTLLPGDHIRAGSSGLTCLAGDDLTVSCGFGTAGRYDNRSMVVAINPRRAAVMEITKHKPRVRFLREHPGGPVETTGLPSPGADRTIELKEGEGATFDGSTLHCTMVEHAAFFCAYIGDNEFQPGTFAISIDRVGVAVGRIRSGNKATRVFHREHPLGREA